MDSIPNIYQQVFVVFYAIAWGTAANVQPRWKAFGYADIGDTNGWKAAIRIFLFSWPLLNLLPVACFLWILGLLSTGVWDLKVHPWSRSEYWPTLAAIVPALMPFGFYKLWMGIVQCLHALCFIDNEVTHLASGGGPWRFHDGGLINIVAGLLLVALAISVPLVVC